MKIYLIAALFLGALVVAHSLEEDEKVELPEVPEQAKDFAEPPDGTEGDNKEMANPPDGTKGDMEADTSDEELTKRRLRNILSSYSCRLLHRRKLCRYAFVRNLCQATCTVCRDKLSPVSCHRLKHTFHRCSTPFGRFFCEHTCGCGKLPKGCRNFAVLNQLNRRQSRPRGNVLLCDKKGFATRWYRFTGLAGNRMPTRPPPKHRCGTHAPGWMVGSYPRRLGQTVRRKVCYHWGKKVCNWSNFIKVKNCGAYFLFYLTRTPVCHLRYCGNA